MPPVVAISPSPSAIKIPTREKLSSVPRVGSIVLPLSEKTYVPFRLALVNPPAGGGTTGVEPPPLQAEAQAAAKAAKASNRRFIAHLSLHARQAFAALGLWSCEP